MNGFQPQVEEIRFAMRAWAQLERPDESISEVLLQAGRFAAGVLAPLDPIGDREGCSLGADGGVRTPTGWSAAYTRFVDGGWNTVHFPAAVGGQGLPAAMSVAVAELFETANVAFSLALMPFPGVVALLDRFGTAEQKVRYLEPLVTGRWSATLAMTEAHAGTDIGAIHTSATHSPDGAAVRGQKCFITYGEHDLNENILHFVLARDPEGRPGVKGLSLYIVPKRRVTADGTLGPLNAVRCIGVENKIGIHGSPTTTLEFGGEGAGAWGERLGEACRGLEQMFVVLNRARLNIGVFGLASAERAWQAANAYARQRVQGSDAEGRPCVIAAHPDVRRMLHDMHSSVQAMRAVCYFAAGALERSQQEGDAAARELWRARLDLLTPIVKGWVTELAFDVASTGVQVAGGIGYTSEFAAGRHFCEARVHPIYEGTTGVQAMDLALRKIGRRCGTAREFLAEIRSDWLAALEDCGLGELRGEAQCALDALDAATAWISARAGDAPALAQAGSVHYLHMWGTVLGSWLLTRAARLEPARASAARFFAWNRLVIVAARWRTIEYGSAAVLHDGAGQVS